MLNDHPTAEDLQSFLLNRQPADHAGSAASNLRIVRHLLAGCAECLRQIRRGGWQEERLERLLTLPAAEVDEPTEAGRRFDYQAAFASSERAVAEFLATARLAEQPSERALDVLLAELGFLPKAEQLRQVAEDPRFARPRLVHRFIERSHKARYQDPVVMLEQANLARVTAGACSVEAAGSPRRLADVNGLAWGYYGNALRVCGRFAEASAALAESERWRERGTGEPVLRARVREFMASMRIQERRLESAMALAEEAGQIYRDLGEGHDLARSMVQKAMASYLAGEPEPAVRLLDRAIPLIEQERDPHLMLAALHNLVSCYIGLERPEDAISLRSETHHLYEEVDDDLIVLRASWQEGELLRALGRLGNAEAALLRVRQGFMQRNLPFEVAVLSLDLAAVYLKMGRSEDTRRTVEEALPIFRSLGVGRETLAALLQLRQVADREQQALNLIRLIASQLGRMPNRLPR